jgi:hypothetical protein
MPGVAASAHGDQAVSREHDATATAVTAIVAVAC